MAGVRFILLAGILAVLNALGPAGHALTVTYGGMGDVLAVDEARRSLTIRPEKVSLLELTTPTELRVRSPRLLAGVRPGSHVRFEIIRDGDRLVLNRVAVLPPAPTPRPGVHDHAPQHGGSVAMAGMVHLEAVAAPEGRVRIYVSDTLRRPLPLDGTSGAIRLDLPRGVQEFSVVARDGALEATTPPLAGPTLRALVHLTRDGRDLQAHLLLPVAATPS
jgi:hypothetical protein